MNQPTLTFDKVFKFLTNDELKTQVPSAFTVLKDKRASYTLIPTPSLINDFEGFGWKPVAGTQMRTKLAKNAGIQKHFIRFRNPKLYVGSKNAISVIPELMLVNSYDAKCLCKIPVSLYRVACDNGCIIETSKFETVLIPHRGDTSLVYLKEYLEDATSNCKLAIELMEKMEKKIMTTAEQHKFVKEAFRSRFDYVYKAEISQMLIPAREADRPSNLWVVYNRLQEKMIKGGWIGSGKRKVKPLTNPDRALLTNRRLFEIAETFL